MRTTKSRSIALERAAELLPDGKVESPAHGRRRLTFRKPKGRGRYITDGTIERCLYVALLAATESPELGGLGLSLEEVRDRVRLRGEGVPSDADRGIGGHEMLLIRACSLDPR
jgi:hypothetical protein